MIFLKSLQIIGNTDTIPMNGDNLKIVSSGWLFGIHIEEHQNFNTQINIVGRKESNIFLFCIEIKSIFIVEALSKCTIP